MSESDQDLAGTRRAWLCRYLPELRELAEAQGAAARFDDLVGRAAHGTPAESATALDELSTSVRRWGDPLGLDGQVRTWTVGLTGGDSLEGTPVVEFYVCPVGRCPRRVRRLLHTPPPRCRLHDADYQVLRLDDGLDDGAG